MRKWLIIMVLLIAVAGIFAAYPVCLGRIYSQQIIDAVKQNNVTLVKSLLDKGANPNTRDSEGIPLLLLSVREHNNDIARLLLDAGADVNIREEIVYSKYYKILLLGNPDILCGGWTALHWVVRKGNLELTELLLAKGADVNACDSQGWTPLHGAVMSSAEADIVKLLVENGADVNAKGNKYGLTPLHMAVMNRFEYFKPEAVKLLIDYGADINSKNSADMTPLYWAGAIANKEAVELFLTVGADVNIKSKHGTTVLHAASRRGDTDMVRILLNAGADVNIKDNEGKTPLDEALKEGHADIAELLKAHGAQSGAELPKSDR